MDDLTKIEQEDLARLEGLIREGLGTFCAVGRALHAIREGRLYRDTYATFEAYCADRWEFSRQRAYQLLAAAAEVGRLSTIVDTPPQRETHGTGRPSGRRLAGGDGGGPTRPGGQADRGRPPGSGGRRSLA